MSELLEALGINGKALLFQAINFGILLIALTWFVYRPLAKIMEERRKKIELGVKGGERAAKIIADAEQVKAQKITEGETQAVVIISKAEGEGQKRSQEIVHGAETKAEYIIEDALATAAKKKQEELEKLSLEANALVKAAIIKTVELDPKAVDEKLISKALHEIHA